MWLSIFKLNNYIHDAGAYQMVTNAQAVHAAIQSSIGTDRAKENVLYRMVEHDADRYLMVQADIRIRELPHCSLQSEVKIEGNYKEGSVVKFSLRTSPNRRNGHHRKYIPTADARCDWVRQKLSSSGGRVISISEDYEDRVMVIHKDEKGGAAKLRAFVYNGLMEVSDHDALKKGVQEGIGPHRAYGMGLLMLSMYNKTAASA